MADAAGVSERTAAKWLARYRREGDSGLVDRSSAPQRIPPHELPTLEESSRCARGADTCGCRAHVAGVITDVPDVAIDIRAALDDENRGTDLVIM
jgi:transposase